MDVAQYLFDQIEALPAEDQAELRAKLGAQLVPPQRNTPKLKKIILLPQHRSVASCTAFLMRTLKIKTIPNPQVFRLDGQHFQG